MPTTDTITQGVTFRRVNGPNRNEVVWALYGPHTILKVGATIDVARRDGTISTVIVGEHYRRDEHGLVYARIAQATAAAQASAALGTELDRFPGMPDGFYAVPSDTGAPFRFYAIERPTRGRYAGRMIVRRVVGGRMGGRVFQPGAAQVLDDIVRYGITEAHESFASQTGNCYVCNRTLTDPESVRLGIGPVCRSRQR